MGPRGTLFLQPWNSSVNNRHSSSQRGQFFWNFRNPFLCGAFSPSPMSPFSHSQTRGMFQVLPALSLSHQKEEPVSAAASYSPHKPPCVVAVSSLNWLVSSCNGWASHLLSADYGAVCECYSFQNEAEDTSLSLQCCFLIPCWAFGRVPQRPFFALMKWWGKVCRWWLKWLLPAKHCFCNWLI